MAKIIDGKAVGEEVLDKVKRLTGDLASAKEVVPGLAVVIVGEDPASQVYVASKSKRARECGFHSVQHTLSADTPEADLLALVAGLNADPAIHGILVQLPLPGHIDAGRVIQAIAPQKDVDGFHFINVGKPMANLLLAANCTVTIAHSRSRDLPALARTADILVAAVGRPEMVRGDWVKPGATVIDVGINRIPAPEKGEGKTRLVGDVAYAEAERVAGAITPVPGGVGPMTIAMLMANTVASAFLSVGLDRPKF